MSIARSLASWETALLRQLHVRRVVIVQGGAVALTAACVAERGWGGSSGALVGVARPDAAAAAATAEVLEARLGTAAVGLVAGWEQQRGGTKVRVVEEMIMMREMLVEPRLTGYSLVVVELGVGRGVWGELLLVLLRRLMVSGQRTELRLIVVVETVRDALELVKFFEMNEVLTSPELNTACLVSVEKRRHPVEIFYLTNPTPSYVDAIVRTVIHIIQTVPKTSDQSNNGILVFVPGIEQVDMVISRLKPEIEEFTSSIEIKIHPLHEKMPPHLQANAVEPSGKKTRKIVISTSVAETSVTVESIGYVVDSMFIRERGIDFRTSLPTLSIRPESKSRAGLRTEAAGRNGPGKCYRLCSELSFEQELISNDIPEIQRTGDLCSIVLFLKALEIQDIAHFPFLSPPSTNQMLYALELLYSLGALDDGCNLTSPTGFILADLQVDPKLGKCLITSFLNGCSEEMLILAAMLSVPSPFGMATSSRRTSHSSATTIETTMRTFGAKEGDHLMLINLYRAYIRGQEKVSRRQWCEERCIHHPHMLRAEKIRTELLKTLQKYGKLLFPSSSQKLEPTSCEEDVESLLRCVVSGFFSNAAILESNGKYRTIGISNCEVEFHSSSLFAKFDAPPECVIYHEILLKETEETGKIRNICRISPQWLLELAPHFYGTVSTS